MTGISKARQTAALQAVEDGLKDSPDWVYWKFHRKRFEHSIRSIADKFSSQAPQDVRILDVGSHFLQLSSILAELGFSVVGLDVEEFSQDPLVKARSSKAGIPNHRIVDLEQGEFSLEENDFDLVLFTETLEHLPFNPQKMWLRLFSLLRPGGMIYLTTPNGLSLRKLPLLFAKLLFRVGCGSSLKQILGKPTFAIHWKEYSTREMKQYFTMLGMDAEIAVGFYRYNPILRSGSLIDWGGAFCNLCAELIVPLREEMEIWITPIETG